MCIKNAMELSLNGDTFAALKEDFDSILSQTLGNMESKSADEAVITLKLGISLEKQQFVRNESTEELTKPSFKHDISSVMQVKNKKSGSLSGDYELVWDEDEKRYVMRKIAGSQMSMFENVEKYEGDDKEIEGQAMLSAPADKVKSVFGWLSDFVGNKMTVSEAMGNYTVRTENGKVILTSASPKNNPLHCDAEVLATHLGHTLVCAGYGDDELNLIKIECEDCLETLFSISLVSPDDTNEDITLDEEPDYEIVAEDSEYDEDIAMEVEYDYSEPEEEEE